MNTPIASTLLAASRGIAVSDLIALAKPRITFMVLVTTAGGYWLAHRALGLPIGWVALVCAVLGTTLIVAGANTLNQFLERDIDKKMTRTMNRPLPAGRLTPRAALWFGVAVSTLSVPILALGVNALTALLAVLAHVSYVLAYTPMKRRSHHALLVGAVPGAIPPLLGWTAATGRVDAAGLVLFGILFLWQVPHFLAITLFRKGDYARAGLVVMPNVTGDLAVRHAIPRYTLALVLTSLLLGPLGVAHTRYMVTALVLGAMFFGAGALGLRKGVTTQLWARRVFLVSLVYLTGLFGAFVFDA
jgi:heme o synthase